jgi:hypothetical protein
MPRIARGEENTTDKINWFTRVLDVLTNMYLVEFQIHRIEDGLPGTQVFPPTGWEDVTAAPGRFDTGSYYAYDNANAQGWTPDAGADLGTHRIAWRWKQFATSSYQENAEDFELVAQAGGGPSVLYNDVADVRAMGLTDPPFTDAQILEALTTWQMVLERACRQWFYDRELTLQLDGNDSDTLHLGVPIISVEYLKINRSDLELSTDRYEVYNRQYPDDRRNPKIRLRHSRQLSDIYIAPWSLGELKFHKGYRNQEIKGRFGFIEPDGSTPAPIKHAHLKLTIEKLTHPYYVPAGEVPPTPSEVYAGVVVEEKTDGHSIKYGSSSYKERRVGLSGITQDPEILDIIKLYRAPIALALQSGWSYY